jgi:hypothetical protein
MHVSSFLPGFKRRLEQPCLCGYTVQVQFDSHFRIDGLIDSLLAPFYLLSSSAFSICTLH